MAWKYTICMYIMKRLLYSLQNDDIQKLFSLSLGVQNDGPINNLPPKLSYIWPLSIANRGKTQQSMESVHVFSESCPWLSIYSFPSVRRQLVHKAGNLATIVHNALQFTFRRSKS